MIEPIVEGMSAGQVFDILNALIAEHNELMAAIGDTIKDGKISYTALTDKPTIDGVEITGAVSTTDFSIATDSLVLQAVDAIETKVSDISDNRISDLRRIGALEDYRTADVSRISTLESEKSSREAELTQFKTEYANAKAEIATRQTAVEAAYHEAITERAEFKENFEKYKGTLQTLVDDSAAAVKADVAREYVTQSNMSVALAAKADAADVPTTAQWNTLKAAMDADVSAVEAKVSVVPAFSDWTTFRTGVINTLQQLKSTVISNSLTPTDCYTQNECRTISASDIVIPVDPLHT